MAGNTHDKMVREQIAYYQLRQTIDAGAPPSLARLPMTPEEVADSYSGPPGSEQVGQWNPGVTATGDDSAS